MATPESIIAAAARDHGATTIEVEGVTVAARFGDPVAEHGVLLRGRGIVDLAGDGVLRATGSDRVEFLHGMLSNDIKARGLGQGCRAFVLTDQGKVVADVAVLITDDTVVLAGAAPGVAAAQPALERYIVADDVELLPSGTSEHVFGLFGPQAVDALTALGVSSPPTGDYDHVAVAMGGPTVRLARLPAPGAGGYLCVVPAADAVAWWSRVVETGAVQPVGHEAFELWRIESGVARHGRDVTSDTIALEAPFEGAISFEKGCYLGQEIVERVSARGKVNRRLVGLLLDGARAPASGAKIVAGEREVGWVTSAAWSWDRERPVALGYVRREHFEPGTTLEVRTADTGVAATVAPLPFD